MAFDGPILQPILLICEGSNDAKVFRGIFRSRSLDHLFQVEYPSEQNRDDAAHGVTGFNRSLRLVRQRDRSACKAVLLVADEDKNGTAQFELVQKEIDKAGLPFPAEQGVKVGSDPPVAILMLPGCLETLIDAPLGRFFTATDCIQAFEACSGASAWTDVIQRTKMRVRSALALWEKNPRISPGRLFDDEGCDSLRADVDFNPFAERCRTFAMACLTVSPNEPPQPS